MYAKYPFLLTHLVKQMNISIFILVLIGVFSGCGGSDNDDYKGFQQGNIESNLFTLSFSLSGAQAVPPYNTTSSGNAEIEINRESGVISGFAETNIDNAIMAHIHRGFAGMNGPPIITLIANGDRWEIPTETILSEEDLQAFLNGELYINIHTEDQPSGALRGQLVPDDIEVIYVTLNGDQEVPPEETTATANAALTIHHDTRSITLHGMTSDLPDAAAAHIHQGIEGVNGPVEFPLTQSMDDPSLWVLDTTTFSQAQFNRLMAAALYINIHTPDFPAGVVRGQIVPESIIELPTLQITSQSPSSNAELDSLPSQIQLDFNSELNSDTIMVGAFSLVRSGGDDSFSEGNEVAITIASAQLIEDNPLSVVLDINGNEGPNDLYQLTVSDTILSSEGIRLDGDATGNAGGNYQRTFTVDSANNGPTFSSIQSTIFSTSCAVSGCHSGDSPAAGMRLSVGEAYTNIVNMPSGQMPTLMRIEPGNPDDSYLIRKLEGTAAVGGRMPFGKPALSQQKIDMIRQWVTAGAKND